MIERLVYFFYMIKACVNFFLKEGADSLEIKMYNLKGVSP